MLAVAARLNQPPAFQKTSTAGLQLALDASSVQMKTPAHSLRASVPSCVVIELL